MGRPSKLTKEQWLYAEHRHVVDGVPLDTLAVELSISATALRRKIKPSIAERERGVVTLRDLAKQVVAADKAVEEVSAIVSELPETRQLIVRDLAQRMKSISVHLTCAAEASAETSKKLALLARAQADRIDPNKPLTDKTRDLVSGISAITRTANEAGAIGMGLIAAHRVGLPGATDAPEGGVADMSDEELDAELRANGIDPTTV